MRLRELLLIALCGGGPSLVWAESLVSQGQKIAFDPLKGNCISCHTLPDADMSGNIAVPLIAMKSRFPDKSVLRENVWDQTQFRPFAMMPPFGKFEILTEQEIDAVVEYLYTL